MFSSLKQRLFAALYVFLLISIPVGSYLVSQNQSTKTGAFEKPKTATKQTSKTATTSAKLDLLSTVKQNLDQGNSPSSNSSPDSSSPTIATSFGPTLALKIALEGRPADNQATKLFVGIVEGDLTSNPKFLLSFTIDLPTPGDYSNLSLAGLNPGTTYTALLKGEAQVASSSTFTMSPAESNLNDGEVINLTTGDLNEDNVINSSDYAIVQKAYGSDTSSPNWNDLADFNKDGVINAFDLSIIVKNLNTTGASGAWTSPIPKTATSSGAINPQGSTGGYWVWIPK